MKKKRLLYRRWLYFVSAQWKIFPDMLYILRFAEKKSKTCMLCLKIKYFVRLPLFILQTHLLPKSLLGDF